jgi:hypothetical protein
MPGSMGSPQSAFTAVVLAAVPGDYSACYRAGDADTNPVKKRKSRYLSFILFLTLFASFSMASAFFTISMDKMLVSALSI